MSITLWMDNSGGVFVFDIKDWVVLRKTYRIQGELGETDDCETLPLKLNPEETVLLMEKTFAKVRKYNNDALFDQTRKFKQSEFEEELLKHMKIAMKTERLETLQQYKSQIIEGKRKKGDSRSEEEIMEEEIEKKYALKINKDNMLWPILMVPQEEIIENSVEVDIEEIRRQTSKLKCMVFKDLWERNYFITTGYKFGGDFCVYAGDPIVYHAIFIVRCENQDDALHPTEIIASGRLATMVRKRAVYASLNDDDSVSYLTLNWLK